MAPATRFTASRVAGMLASRDEPFEAAADMPIVDIEIVGDPKGAIEPGLAQALADGAGAIFGAAPGTTWVRVRRLPATAYAEHAAPVQPSEWPVFVTVTRRELPERAALGREAAALAHAVAQTVGRSATRVHVEYAPAASGRIALGGTLVE